MASKAGPFTFAELQMVTSLGRGEVRECVNRGIIKRSRRGRTGQPPSLFKVEPGGRRDRGGVVAAYPSRVGRRFDDETALAAHGSSQSRGHVAVKIRER